MRRKDSRTLPEFKKYVVYALEKQVMLVRGDWVLPWGLTCVVLTGKGNA